MCYNARQRSLQSGFIALNLHARCVVFVYVDIHFILYFVPHCLKVPHLEIIFWAMCYVQFIITIKKNPINTKQA